MIDFTVPYREVIKISPAEDAEEIVCIREGSLEPVFDSYVRYYNPHLTVRYTDVHGYLAEDAHVSAVAILTLREIAPTLWEKLYTLDDTEIRTHVENVKQLLTQLIEKMERCSSRTVFFLLHEQGSALLCRGMPSAGDIAAELNAHVLSIAHSTQIFDTSEIAAQAGTQSFWDEHVLYRFGCPFSREGCNALAYYTAEAMKPPKPKKCIVCDCDSVLWGGILADDGFDGIELSGEFSGRRYRDFQRELCRFSASGILVCLCSKNAEEDVRNVLTNHPDMILREPHIAAMRINYENKADNIRSIANELNISTEDMVFLDDSTYEIGLVQAELPEILCIHMDANDPAKYTAVLRELSCLQKSTVTDEDRRRTQQYQAAHKRNTVMAKTADLAAFHKRLNTRVTIRKATDFDIPRVVQLALRTNQGNLANTHPDIGELRRIADDPRKTVLCLHASDIYGDMGIVAAAVVDLSSHKAVVTHFWLSCRAFQRGFEDDLIAEAKRIAADAGYSTLYGIYVPTEKNKLFKDFYQKNGVKLLEELQ